MSKKRAELDYLKEKIEASGFPLEIEVSNYLDSEYSVYNTYYYFDAESKQGRSIDIVAEPKFLELVPLKTSRAFANISVAIECKKSNTHAWILFTRPAKKSFRWREFSGQIKTTIPCSSQPPPFEDWLYAQLMEVHHFNKFERIAIDYDEIKKEKYLKPNDKERGRNDIFEAITQLSKFVCFEIHQILEAYAKSRMKSQGEMFLFVSPVIVFDGELIEAFHSSNEMRLEHANHILLKTNYLCPYCHRIESFLIDVVHRSYFEEYMKIFKNDVKQTENILTTVRNEFFEVGKLERERIAKAIRFKKLMRDAKSSSSSE
jgi:hypothetical protein